MLLSLDIALYCILKGNITLIFCMDIFNQIDKKSR